MPHYKLHYFDIRSRGEPIRWLFAVAKQPYEELRISAVEWISLKSTYLFGQLPVLEIDGKPLYQSYAIIQYLAKQFGLAGKTPLDEARACMVAHCIEDGLYYPWALVKQLAPDEEKEGQFLARYANEQLPQFLNNLEKILSENNGSDKFFVGDELTYADLVVVAFFEEIYNLLGVQVDLDKHPKLAELKSRVESIPAIADFLSQRPSIDKPLIKYFNGYIKKLQNGI